MRLISFLFLITSAFCMEEDDLANKAFPLEKCRSLSPDGKPQEMTDETAEELADLLSNPLAQRLLLDPLMPANDWENISPVSKKSSPSPEESSPVRRSKAPSPIEVDDSSSQSVVATENKPPSPLVSFSAADDEEDYVSFVAVRHAESPPAKEENTLFSLGRSLSEVVELGTSLPRELQNPPRTNRVIGTNDRNPTPALAPSNEQPMNPLARKLKILTLEDQTTRNYWERKRLDHVPPPKEPIETAQKAPSLDSVET